jgi:tetratricopeptide (TPR) repeat protein
MEANFIIVVLVGISVLQTLWSNIVVNDPKYNSGIIMVAILIGLLTPALIYAFPQWGAWLLLALWFCFLILPSRIRDYSFGLTQKNRFDEAIKLQNLARILHPFNQYPAHPEITEAKKLEAAGDTEGAIQILCQFEHDSQWRIYAMERAFMLKEDYAARLSWIRENISEKDYRRDPSLLQGYVNALGRTGDLNTMLSEFMRLKSAPQRIAQRLMENYITIFAYCGGVEQVEALLETSFQYFDDASKQLWLGRSHYAAGNIDEAVQILTKLLKDEDKVIRKSAQSFLGQPPVVAKDVLSPESKLIL